MVSSVRQAAAEASQDKYESQMKKDAAGAMKRVLISLKIWARLKALRQWKKNADECNRLNELTSLHAKMIAGMT